MQVRAKAKFIRMSPRKVRLVANFVRGKSCDEAVRQLKFMNKTAATPVLSVLQSAIANAKENHSVEQSDLVVSEILINDGPTIKRFRPRARGSAAPIRKRTSHLTVAVSNGKEDVVSVVPKIEIPKAASVEKGASAADNKEEKTPVVEEKATEKKTESNES